jgi:hypothetical protein
MKSPSRHPGSRSAERKLKLQCKVTYNRADIYVGTNFRYWLTGFQTGDLSYWERAFSISARSFGIGAARDVCRDFSQWVRLLSEYSQRQLRVSPPDSPSFGRDECVAMALIAAYQHKSCPALQVCAMTLLGCEPRKDVCELSGALAHRLSDVDHVLSGRAVDHVVRYAEPGFAGSAPHLC